LPADRAAAERERWCRIASAVRGVESERCAPQATTADLLRRPETEVERLTATSPLLRALEPRERRIVAETIKYAGYVERQRREAERLARAAWREIPVGFAYRGLAGLSNELVEKLERVSPENLGRASRIDGMTPAALSLLAVHLERIASARARA
jgi:tRNA uridine 5-carboxymethylaminomethyl modification enzyme